MSETPESLSRTLSCLLDREPGTYCTYRLHTVWCWEEESSTDLRRLHCAFVPPSITPLPDVRSFVAHLKYSMSHPSVAKMFLSPVAGIDVGHDCCDFSPQPHSDLPHRFTSFFNRPTCGLCDPIGLVSRFPRRISTGSGIETLPFYFIPSSSSSTGTIYSEDNKDPGETSNKPR